MPATFWRLSNNFLILISKRAGKFSMPDFKQFQTPKSNDQNLRILLWDIDGTLMTSTKSGAFREYFAPAMMKVYGSSGKLADLNVSGMTDTQIFYEALREEGFTPEQILAPKDEILKVFKEEMLRVVERNKPSYRMLPGARQILEATSQDPRFFNALLTGNLSVAAEIKLSHLDLWKYFENAPNIFGEISHDRRDLGKAAVRIVGDYLNLDLKPEQFIVIGDTPNDISAARAFGAKMVSVATGRNHPAEELSKFDPDVLLENLSDTQKVLAVLESL
jgi:phosphoglycolate phosphatase-like HAD superfamily hydrolase